MRPPLFLMPAGITFTEGDGRVAPESEELHHRLCGLAFGGKTYGLVSMTDGALCYRCRCEQCKAYICGTPLGEPVTQAAP